MKADCKPETNCDQTASATKEARRTPLRAFAILGFGLGAGQALSNTAAMPWPPPMHMVSRP